MRRHSVVPLIFLLVIHAARAQNPTPQQIVSGWSALSGGLGGKVVFTHNNSVYVMDMTTGLSTKIGTGDVTSSWSPDGKRIAVHNGANVEVWNEDGSNKKIVLSTTTPHPYCPHGWTAFNDTIIACTGTIIVRMAINSDNSAGATRDLVTDPPAGGNCYTDCDQSGDYLCYTDYLANVPTGGGHRPIVRNLATGVVIELVARNSDGCDIRIKPDGSGAVIFDPGSHTIPAVIKSFATITIGTVAPLNNRGIDRIQWSNDPRFLVNGGAGSYEQQCWIRNLTAATNFYLGDSLHYADLWVGTSQAQKAATPQFVPAGGTFADSVLCTLSTATQGADIYYTTNGTTPTTQSIRYAGPFTLTNTATVKAIAIKAGLTSSDVGSADFLKLAALDPDTPYNPIPGLAYDYYEGTWISLPVFDQLTRKDSGTVAAFGLPTRPANANFGFVFTGYINVIANGLYTFFVNADDGANLFIGRKDSCIVANDGTRTAAQEASGAVGLKAGYHAVKVIYFCAAGASALAVSWQGPGLAKQAIAPSVLFHESAPVTITLISPLGSRTYALGDTVSISWKYNNSNAMHAAVPELSRNGGRSYPIALFGAPIATQAGLAGSAVWTIPADTAYLTTQGYLRVSDYDDPSIRSAPDSVLTIRITAAARPIRRALPLGDFEYKGGLIIIHGADALTRASRVRLIAADGEMIMPIIRRTAAGAMLGLPRKVPGIYIAGITDGNGKMRELLPLVLVR